MEVHQDRQKVLRTLFSVPDDHGPALIWQRAGRKPFATDDKVNKLEPDEGDPLRCTLEGNVRIRILHGDRVMTGATLTNVTFIRDTNEEDLWYLARDEVSRAQQAAGL